MMGGDLDPLAPRRRPLDPGLGQRRTESLGQEALLVGPRGPELEDDQ
ncbi:MAG: hypothetical protein QOH18_585, partial [Solirubrobacterales bacterium]|nr:hypothetical protein [Solirubrobacterales bacterium]